jgi:hypothetical protein
MSPETLNSQYVVKAVSEFPLVVSSMSLTGAQSVRHRGRGKVLIRRIIPSSDSGLWPSLRTNLAQPFPGLEEVGFPALTHSAGDLHRLFTIRSSMEGAIFV